MIWGSTGVRDPLILASASPRRRELLALLDVPFEVIPSQVVEPDLDRHSDAEAHARELALAKAIDVAERHSGRWVLGADTVVWMNTRLFAKPDDDADAARMLRELAGRTHHVTTGVALVGPGGRARAIHSTTEVTFRPLNAAEIAAYVATGEPRDKAGAYAIQGRGALLITAIRGDYPNVVGLPVVPLAALLTEVTKTGRRSG